MHAGASLPLNSGRRKCKNKFAFEQREGKQMYAGTRLPLNSGDKSKFMQEQVYF